MNEPYHALMQEQNERISPPPPLQRHHRHTTSLTDGRGQRSVNAFDRHRAATVAPSLPPKQKSQGKKLNLFKTQSLDISNHDAPYQQRAIENPYISHQEIQSFPENRQRRSCTVVRCEEDRQRSLPNIQGVRPRGRSPTNRTIAVVDPQGTARKPPLSPTRFLANNQADLYTTAFKSDEQRDTQPPTPPGRGSQSPETGANFWVSGNYDGVYNSMERERTPQSSGLRSTSYTDASTVILESSAVPTTAPKGNYNFVDDLTKIQNRLLKLYKRVQEAPEESAMLRELKAFLRLGEHESVENTLEGVHMSLAPPRHDPDSKMMYVVDFRSFRDKHELRHQIIEMFAKPGPPSISYAKVDAKMDAIIAEFCVRVTNLRETQSDLVQSPAHARAVLKGVSDREQLVKALRDNQLWIRWGTSSNLPPLYHLYLHKQPPSYEVRKAVTISFIAERLRMLPDMLSSITDDNLLCPPIYSRLKTEGTKSRWQVTEYNVSMAKYDTHECQFPSWLDDESTAVSLLNSSNRTSFELGAHPYALYSVYVIIIKDFTLAQEGNSRNGEKEWATPSKVQFYVGSSSTGVLYKFTRVENSHCKRVQNVLSHALTLRHFRCYEGCDLVEACLALAWARRQPRAVFVLNSFLPTSMSSLSLEQKVPFRERMLALVGHLTDGKKLGPLCDMRYGMNGTTTIQSEDD